VSISRYGITQAGNGPPGISKADDYGGIGYPCGVTPEPEGDITTRTWQVLARIDRRLPTAQVRPFGMASVEEHNSVGNDWVDRANPPVRAGVRSELWKPGVLVQVMATAAGAR
jgi:enamine deaminase RidA (YjgF/YER057c/UK114 family)